MLTLSCPGCGSTLRLPESAAGKTGRCPKCQSSVTAPLVTAPESVATGSQTPPPTETPLRAVENDGHSATRKGKRKKSTKKQSGSRDNRRLIFAGVALGAVLALGVGGGLIWARTAPLRTHIVTSPTVQSATRIRRRQSGPSPSGRRGRRKMELRPNRWR